MEKFTAEQILHLLMVADMKDRQSFLDFAKLENADESTIKKTLVIREGITRCLIDEFSALLKAPRGFDVCRGFEDKGVKLPERATMCSAGYDIRALDEVVIPPKGTAKISTGVKAYMEIDEVLMLYPRSSMGIKKNVNLANGVAVIDADYYNNPANDGHIIICLYNFGDNEQKIEAGERVAQGVFCKYGSCGDIPDTVRQGGTGSTGTK